MDKVAIMLIPNFWKSLFRPSGCRVRRHRWHVSSFSSLPAEVLEVRQLLSAAAPQMSLTLSGNNLALTSTDINNPTVSITRSGNFVVFTGSNGTQITYTNNGSIGTTQSIALGSLNSLTVNLGTGSDTIAIAGLSTTGNIVINGRQIGQANLSISSGSTNATIGGSIQANLGGETTTLAVLGSSVSTLTVAGSINVTEGGSGSQQVNLGSKLVVTGGVGVVDNGTGQSGFLINDGVTIGGNVSFDNSSSNVNGDTVQILSSSTAGVTSIGGTLSLALANSVFFGNTVTISGTGSLLPVTGATTITAGDGDDVIRLSNTWFKNTVTVNSRNSLPFGPTTPNEPDQVIVQGSRFDGATQIIMDGPYAALGLQTLNNTFSTIFNSTFSAQMTGPSAAAYLANAASTSTSPQLFFKSTATLTGGSPAGTLYVQGAYSGKLTTTSFTTTPPAVIKPRVSLTLSGNNLTLTSTDINNPTVTITRSGNFVVFTGSNNTQITYTNNGTTGTTQSIPLASLNNLTINLGTGLDIITISGLSTTGDISINGQAIGTANVSISAGAPSVTIGGSIQADFSGESAVLNVFGSGAGGGSLTVNGSINVYESGSGNKQINIAGPLAGSPTGGKLNVKGSLSVVDSGNGRSGMQVFSGVTIAGNVSFDNSVNNTYGNVIEIDSNSALSQTTSIGGSLTLALSNAAYSGDSVKIIGNQAASPTLAVTGATDITTGGGNDNIRLENVWFKNSVKVDSGTSLSFSSSTPNEPDQVVLLGSEIDGATTMILSGPYAALGIGTVVGSNPVVILGAFSALMVGPNASVFLSNATSTTTRPQVLFASTASFTGGSPAGTIFFQGFVSVNASKLTLTNFTRVNSTTVTTGEVSTVQVTDPVIISPFVSFSGGAVPATGYLELRWPDGSGGDTSISLEPSRDVSLSG